MNVTRDVIYDLLPGYFSGDISPDTKALVDEFLRQDPEFSKMMERFRTMFREPRHAGVVAGAGGYGAGVYGERETFERARTWLQKRSELRGYMIAFGLAAVFVAFIAMTRMTPTTNVGPWAIAAAFAATSVVAGAQLYFLKAGKQPGG
jgi:anti-sigma factor RsiW